MITTDVFRIKFNVILNKHDTYIVERQPHAVFFSVFMPILCNSIKLNYNFLEIIMCEFISKARPLFLVMRRRDAFISSSNKIRVKHLNYQTS
jgi:hypothetical protein